MNLTLKNALKRAYRLQEQFKAAQAVEELESIKQDIAKELSVVDSRKTIKDADKLELISKLSMLLERVEKKIARAQKETDALKENVRKESIKEAFEAQKTPSKKAIKKFDDIKKSIDKAIDPDAVDFSKGLTVKKPANDATFNINYVPEQKVASLVEKMSFRKDGNVEDLGDNEGLDLRDNAKACKILGRRKKMTMMMVQTPHIAKDGNGEWFVEEFQVPWNNATRLFIGAGSAHTKSAVVKIPTKSGKDVYTLISKEFIVLEGNPLIYMDFVQQPSGQKNSDLKGYQDTVRAIRNGVVLNGIRYEYCGSSASQVRNNKGVFVREDHKVQVYYLDKINDDNYREYLSTLRGSEALLEVLTTGALSCKFSNKFYLWLVATKGQEIADRYSNIERKEVKSSVMKFMARAFLTFSASNPLGNIGEDWNIKRIGKVKIEPTHLKEILAKAIVYNCDTGKFQFRYKPSELDNIVKFWGNQKLDGQGLIRYSAVKKAYKKYYNMKINKKFIGRLMQYRIGSFVKGTVLIVDDKVLDRCKDTKGDFVYRGYDVIVDNNSWKHEISDFYTGEIAPSFSLAGISKPEKSNKMNYQFFHFIDGNNMNDPSCYIEDLKSLVDENMVENRKALVEHDANVALKLLGVIDTENISNDLYDELDTDAYEMTMKSRHARALATEPGLLSDPYILSKLYQTIFMDKEKMKYGRIRVKGASRYVISDPIAMLRTDLGVYKDDGLLYITITEPEQMGLKDPISLYWDGQQGPCCLFRNPNSHAGEAQPHSMTRNYNHVVHTGYGTINVDDIYGTIHDVIVLSVFCNTLESLGGADTDGDKLFICTDKRLIKHRNLNRKSVFCQIDKSVKEDIITMSTIRETIVGSLRSDMVGITTDYSTTWRDIQQNIKQCYLNQEVIPDIFMKVLYKAKKQAERNAQHEEWVATDPSIMALVNIKLSNINYMEICRVIDIMLETIKMLQESTIETPKNGIYVSYKSIGGKNDYQHLCVKIRPTWLKPDADEESYMSNSPMGQLAVYCEEAWTSLYNDMVASAAPFSLLDKNIAKPDLALQEAVAKIRADYGRRAYNITEDKKNHVISEDHAKTLYEQSRTRAASELNWLAMSYSISDVAIAAYDATYAQYKATGDKCSFIWSCYLDEFLTVLSNASRKQSRLHTAMLYSEYTRTVFDADATYTAKDKKLYLNDVEIGTCKTVPDGDYNAIISNGKLYLVVSHDVEKDESALSAKGLEFRLVGMKYRLNNTDIYAAKAAAMELIAQSNNIIAMRPDKGELVAYAMVDGEYKPFAKSNKDQTGFNSVAVNCFIKVEYVPANEQDNMKSALALKVVDITNMPEEEQ